MNDSREHNGNKGPPNTVAGLPIRDQSFAGCRLAGEGEGRCAPLASGAPPRVRVEASTLKSRPVSTRRSLASAGGRHFLRKFRERAGADRGKHPAWSCQLEGRALSPSFQGVGCMITIRAFQALTLILENLPAVVVVVLGMCVR